MATRYNRIIQGDCIKQLKKLSEGSVDLAFADPPFNIGYAYDEYDDNQSCEDYLAWSKRWIAEVIRVLKSDGTFWLAIGDEYAAELKVIATRELGFTCRSWVVWYYTFGVHCKAKFARSHAHLFHFVKDAKSFTFNDTAIRVPSARQLVYADKRANPAGRVPDDTWILRPTPDPSWILRPQDLPAGFTADSDTWYFPRVCGTFKERMGFHGCQMPEQLLGRIINACSNEGDLVLDPFAGSGTTLAVAKKLKRQYVGFDVSKQYVTEARERLTRTRPGQPLDGAENPLTSVANTANGKVRTEKGRSVKRNTPTKRGTRAKRIRGLDEFSRAIIGAFKRAHEGFSTDRVIADPQLNRRFLDACTQVGVDGTPTDWNLRLFRLRKASVLSGLGPLKRTWIPRDELDQCEFGSEAAMTILLNEHEVTLDGLLCDPGLAIEFDDTARRFAPGWTAFHYRWAALRIRKRRKEAATSGAGLARSIPPMDFARGRRALDIPPETIPDRPSVYLLSDASKTPLYVGATENMRRRFAGHFGNGFSESPWRGSEEDTRLRLPVQSSSLAKSVDQRGRLNTLRGLQSFQISLLKPRWNLQDLGVFAKS